MQETWISYLRKKLRESLKKWNLDTGGGKGVWSNFKNYAKGETSAMLTWIFILDMKKGGLLMLHAGSRTPAGICHEAGAGKSAEVDLSASLSKKRCTQQQISQSLESLNKMKDETGNAMKEIVSLLARQRDATVLKEKSVTDQASDINNELVKLNEARVGLDNPDLQDIYTPDTKRKASNGIRKRKLELKVAMRLLFPDSDSE